MKKLILFLCLGFILCGCQNNREVTNKNNIKTEFLGKPSVIVFGGTNCPHCQEAIPVFKKEIWNNYKEKANIWINVVNNKLFDITEIPQGFKPKLTFKALTQKECSYIPAWVLLNSKGDPVLSSCGNEKNINDIKNKLTQLLN